MTDCTSPEGHELEIVYDAIGVNEDGDDAYVYLAGCINCRKRWLDFELSTILNAHASLQQENERLREFARWVGDNYHVTDWPFASINANAVRAKLDALLTRGE